MFILTATADSAILGKVPCFSGVKMFMGQPMAQLTLDASTAKKFATRAAAAKMQQKWNGTGIGMDKFTEIVEVIA